MTREEKEQGKKARVLEVLKNNGTKMPLNISEVAQQAGIVKISAAKWLRVLEAERLVESKNSGNSIIYKANEVAVQHE